MRACPTQTLRRAGRRQVAPWGPSLLAGASQALPPPPTPPEPRTGVNAMAHGTQELQKPETGGNKGWLVLAGVSAA